MPIILKNKELQLTLETPGEVYKHCRFDWNGLVSQVHYKSMPLLSEEKPQGAQNPARFGRGLHNEFGIRKVIGYEDVPVGEWFPKIGTGWLKKDSKPYFFYDDYEMEPFTFFTENDRRSAVFKCISGERNDYSFDYTKKIELFDNRFIISYTLKNHGARTLHSDEYIHNFLGFNNGRIGPDYRLTFPYTLQPDNLIETSSSSCPVQFDGDSLFLVRESDEQYAFNSLSGGRETEAAWTLVHGKERIALSERGDFTTSLINLWGWGHVISPELFYSFTLEPGEETRWQREYTISSL